MNKTIKTLLKKRADNKTVCDKTLETLQTEIQTELDKVFDKSQDLKDAVSEMDDSKEYGYHEHGDVSRWVRFYVPSQFESVSAELSEWFSEYHCLNLDTENDCLHLFCGECIIVNDDGDVFSAHDLIISAAECKDDDDEYSDSIRNKLIESHMEKTGFYPEVLRETYHGDLFYIDTKAVSSD